MKLLSVVVPLYNEAEVLEEFHSRLAAHLAALNVPCEIILVDDGSTDSSAQVGRALCRRDGAVRLIRFSRNFGQQSAITAGLHHARGDAVVVMDADLQDPPELIADLLAKYREGFEIVYAVRQKRKESLLKRALYKLYYRVMRFISVVKIPVDTGDFCIMSRRAVDLLNRLPERNRYIRGLRSWLGYAQTGIPYERHRRLRGSTKYTPRKMALIAIDGIVSFARLPFQLIMLLGAVLVALAAASVPALIVTGNAGSVLLWLGAGLLFLNGMLLIGLGLVGEVVWHISDEVKCRPSYIIEEKAGFGQETASPGGPLQEVPAGGHPGQTGRGGDQL